ncbi:hypothetical protein OKW45_007430 [Paraburkholderia sp. WSM4175]|uniref:SLAC1 family transporter n=1 Tax=Paraburkholderia sp. WSM4175 TaxID=2991072 RepID=UPI003D1ABD02
MPALKPRQSWLQAFQPTSFSMVMATFWIPPLAALFIEKHVIIGEPVRYTAGEWSVVFPLGMYSAATCLYAEATQLHFQISSSSKLLERRLR